VEKSLQKCIEEFCIKVLLIYFSPETIPIEMVNIRTKIVKGHTELVSSSLKLLQLARELANCANFSDYLAI
jgi:hypothetical protein